MIDLRELKEIESEAINKTMLMMSYNPSCGRIFSHETNMRIKDSIYNIVKILAEIKTEDEFKLEHKKILEYITNKIQNSRGREISYGQAQKGLNVFLKVYVDWANLTNPKIAETIRPFLHCPLDSVVMKTLKDEEEALYIKYDKPPCDLKNIKTYEQYMSWQSLIREIVNRDSWHEKAVLVDVIWYKNSLKIKK